MKKTKKQIDALIRKEIQNRITALSGKKGSKAKRKTTKKLLKGAAKFQRKKAKPNIKTILHAAELLASLK